MLRYAGNLYGTTNGGGDAKCQCGVVFRLDAKDKLTVLYKFTGGKDGAAPQSNLIRDSRTGSLYGTTYFGGSTNCGIVARCGTVFKLAPPTTGGTWTETLLHAFDGNDGQFPEAGLIRDSSGHLYGTTSRGGAAGQCLSAAAGVVFELTTSETEQVLYKFTGGSDAGEPLGNVIRDATTGAPYGTAPGCQTVNAGVVFKLD